MRNFENQLKAGAFLSKNQALNSTDNIDKINANFYKHPALGDRVVVRLNSSALSKGEDLKMNYFGFDKSEMIEDVAQRKKKALGFSGWVWINDPKHAHYALEVEKELKKITDIANLKSDYGLEIYSDIAEELGRSVPHFLPVFWEDIGRNFMNSDNASLGSKAFSKARNAEKIHGLNVNIDEQKDIFVEFALGDALSSKDLTQYSKDLLANKPYLIVWQLIRSICLQRILGGLPPWSGMAKILRSLMRRAKLDQDEEEQLFIKDIIKSPAILNYYGRFWSDYSTVIQELIKSDQGLGKYLLLAFPESQNKNIILKWLGHLQNWGLLDYLESEEFLKDNGIVPWFNKLLPMVDANSSTNDSYRLIFELLDLHQNSILKDGRSLNLSHPNNNGSNCNLNILEKCLELKLLIQDPDYVSFGLNYWLEDFIKNPALSFDPVLTLNEACYRSALMEEFEDIIGEESFEKACAEKKIFQEVRKQWFAQEVNDIKKNGVDNASNKIDLLKTKVNIQLLEENPSIYQEFCEIDLANNLCISLQGGIIDEFGWPALEMVCEKLDQGNKIALEFYECAPFVLVTDKKTVIYVVGPNEIEMEFDLRLPKGYEFCEAYYLNKDILIILEKSYEEQEAYWASNPNNRFIFDDRYYGDRCFVSWQRDDGAFLGHKVIAKGQEISGFHLSDFFTDNISAWKIDCDYSSRRSENIEYVIYEYDVHLGIKIRKGIPTFLNISKDDKFTLDTGSCYLNHPDKMTEDPPLGEKDGLSGWCVIERINKGVSEKKCIGIDGRNTFLGEKNKADRPSALMKWPGSSEYKLINADHMDYDIDSGIYSENGECYYSGANDLTYHCAGQVRFLSVFCWQNLIVRDDSASHQLRKITRVECYQLLLAGIKDAELITGKKDIISEKICKEKPWLEIGKAIERIFKKEINSRLKKGIVGIVQHAVTAHFNLKGIIKRNNKRINNAKDTNSSEELILLCDSLKNFGIKTEPKSFELMSLFFKRDISERSMIDGRVFDLIQKIQKFPFTILGELFEKKYITDLESICKYFSKLNIIKLLKEVRISTVSFDSLESLPFQLMELEKSDFSTRYGWKNKFGWCVIKDSAYLMKVDYGNDNKPCIYLLEYSPDKNFIDLDMITYLDAKKQIESWSQEKYAELALKINNNGLPKINKNQLLRVSKETGLNRSQAVLLWCGLPSKTMDDYDTDLTIEFRNFLGLNAKQAKFALSRINTIAEEKRKKIRSKMQYLIDYVWMVDDGIYADHLIKNWNEIVGKTVYVSEDLFTEVDNEIESGDKLVELLTLLDDKESALYHDRKMDPFETLLRNPSEFRNLDERVNALTTCLDTIILYFPVLLMYLYENLPVGNEYRNQMAKLYELSIRRLASPNSIVQGEQMGNDFTGEDDLKPIRNHFKTAIYKHQYLGDKIKCSLHTSELINALDDSNLILTTFRPCFVQGSEQVAFLKRCCGEGYKFYSLLISKGLQEMNERILNSPVPAGQYEMNPKYCVPELVEEAKEEYQLTDVAAILYLQILTLAKPTRKNILIWNQWSNDCYRNANQELFEKKLLIRAERVRAGRNHFLPGAWQDLRSPQIPMESRKLSMYHLKLDSEGNMAGGTQLVNQDVYGTIKMVILPRKPYHLLFQDAWQRIKTGDLPKYEDVK